MGYSLCFTIVLLNLTLVNLAHLNINLVDGNNTQRLIKRQTNGCFYSQEFQCNSGQCISRYDVCDGVKHCTDSSDETLAACRQVEITTCTPSSFQCKYGACISRLLQCDGNIDCITDGSDEEGCGKEPQPLSVSGGSISTQTLTSASVCNSVGDDQTYSQCDNGQCIDKYSVCDGIVDCHDKSDETETACFRLFQGNCPELGVWRCKYGACLSPSVRCNGRNECLDGSDEEGCSKTSSPTSLNTATTEALYSVNTPRPITQTKPVTVQSFIQPIMATGGKTCQVPEYPQNRQFTLLHCKGVCGLSPSQIVPEQTLMVVTCDPGHHHSSPNNQFITSCTNGEWFPDIPHCVKLCPTLTSTTVDMFCWQGPDDGCDKPMLPKTKINFKCKDGYTANIENMPDVIRCEESGEWSGQLPQCTPKCGVSNLEGYLEPTVVGGEPSKVGNFPWHAAIFHRRNGQWEAACGGTLITSKVVLTAAHCVTEKSSVEPPLMSVKDILVALGKYRREWRYHDESESVVEVREIHIYPHYKGQPRHYEHDIATLVLAYDVFVSSNVMPACVDYSGKYVEQLFNGKKGYIAGWGNTIECSSVGQVCESHSPILLFTRTSIMSYDECYRATQPLHPAFDSKLTSDKYCAGDGKTSIVQQGDSGGGLTFVFGGKHYVYGIVSTKLKMQTETQTFYTFASFTSVPHYKRWLQNQV